VSSNLISQWKRRLLTNVPRVFEEPEDGAVQDHQAVVEELHRSNRQPRSAKASLSSNDFGPTVSKGDSLRRSSLKLSLAMGRSNGLVLVAVMEVTFLNIERNTETDRAGHSACTTYALRAETAKCVKVQGAIQRITDAQLTHYCVPQSPRG